MEAKEFEKNFIARKIKKVESQRGVLALFFTNGEEARFEIRLDAGQEGITPYMRVRYLKNKES